MLLSLSNFKCWLHYKISMLPGGRFSTTAAPTLSLGALSHHVLLLLASSHTLTISAASLQQSQCQNQAAKINRSSPPYTCLSECPHATRVPIRISSGKSHGLSQSRPESCSGLFCLSWFITKLQARSRREGHCTAEQNPCEPQPFFKLLPCYSVTLATMGSCFVPDPHGT